MAETGIFGSTARGSRMSIGNLDWSSWIYGLVAGFIGGGAGAVSAAFGLILTDPNYNMANPRKLITVMVWTFVLPGLVAGLAYLKQNPLPTEIKTTIETTQVQQNPPAIVKTTVETTSTEVPK